MGDLIGAASGLAWQCALVVADVLIHGFGVAGMISP